MTAKSQISSFWQNIPFRGYVYASIILNLFTILSIYLVRNFLPPVLPLFYGRPEGQGQLVSKFGLLVAPLTALAITLINILLGLLIKQSFIQRILVVSAFLLSVLTTITIAKIVFLVGFF